MALGLKDYLSLIVLEYGVLGALCMDGVGDDTGR